MHRYILTKYGKMLLRFKVGTTVLKKLNELFPALALIFLSVSYYAYSLNKISAFKLTV